MKYESTQGAVRGATFEEALLSGYASDGGLFMPENTPKIDEATLQSWAHLAYSDLVKKIVRLFIDEKEIPTYELEATLDRAFCKFNSPNIVQLSSHLNILELFHGPTLAFKDMAMSCVGQFLEYFLAKRKKHMTVLVSTSGDTGSSAIESVRGLTTVDIIVLLPRDRCSQIQELQMTTVTDDNVHVYRVDGTSDDLDEPIKRCFLDAEFSEQYHLMSLNSINWARIMVQIVHFFYAYLQMCPACDGEVEVVIPTGGCGNTVAGCLAQRMGLPLHIVCSVNTNDVVAKFIMSGEFLMVERVHPSLAPSMDIRMPYNIERLVYLFSDRDRSLTKAFIADFQTSHCATLPHELLQKIQAVLGSYVVDDSGIQAAMKQCWHDNAYLLCPHTATAAQYHYSHTDSKVQRVCIATASPAKFKEAVLSAGLTPQPTAMIERLQHLATKYQDVEQDEDWDDILRCAIKDISKRHLKGAV
ncbi:Threonine synthase-like 2 [Lamellibrachia satsuma]|nr:Threonine synthase-like 2 [Lamellibrachia satsuma]